MVIHDDILVLPVKDRWNVWFFLREYPIINLKDISLECGEPLPSLKEYLILFRLVEKVGKGDKFKFKCSINEALELKNFIETSTMRDWSFNDCHNLYCEIGNHERKIINRLVFSSGKVSVRILMELISSKGYFKIFNLERKIIQFSKRENLIVPICREKLYTRTSYQRTVTFYFVCSEKFRDYMKQVIRTFQL